MFQYQNIDLPVKEVIPEIQEKLATSNTLIVQAPPGAGKSTLLPLALFEQGWLRGKKILMLEPRRLAAKSVATRMAQLLGEEVGQTVGYKIRFENCTSEKTRIEVLTEGILTRMIHSDNSLEDVGLVIFDEFHERSIHADVGMVFCRETQQVLREDLRILVMSATLDMTQLSTLLDAEVIESKGRQYPVDIFYAGDSDEFLLPELMSRTIVNATKNHEGDVLAFLPGQGEIRKCEELLRKQLRDFRIHPLYGQLPYNKQQQAILPDKQGKRKVVLATSIAETSLTIEGVKIVVDSGLGRTQKFDPNSGLSRLETIQISKDSADQRAGRAGRLSEGFCYRMWSSATHHRLAEHRTPEIEEADLASFLLDMAQWGIANPTQLSWLTPPPKGNLAQASSVLHDIEALENRKITEHGSRIHRLPCHPRIAHLLLIAEEDGMLGLATDIAALLEERDPLPHDAGIDINLRIEALRRFRKKEGSASGKLKNIEKVAAQYRKLFNSEEDNDAVDDYETGILLAQAYPERIACARPGNNAQFQLANGKLAQASHKDDLAFEPWLAVANLNAREGMGRIFLASPLNPQDLQPLVKEQEIITWDTRLGGLIASRDLRIGNIVLKSTPLPDPDESHLVQAICDAIKKEGERLLNFDDDTLQLQNRMACLRRWNPEQQWQDFSTEALLLSCEEWLTPYLTDVKSPEQLKKLNLKDILLHSLEYEQQQLLAELAPERIQVPSGSNIKITYEAKGQPVLAVRLQEVFGLEDTPKLNNGKMGVLMHLLSPGFKPVQVTSDLQNFWKETYFEVRKELKRRYPKHAWPDDPLSAEAVRGVKRK